VDNATARRQSFGGWSAAGQAYHDGGCPAGGAGWAGGAPGASGPGGGSVVAGSGLGTSGAGGTAGLSKSPGGATGPARQSRGRSFMTPYFISAVSASTRPRSSSTALTYRLSHSTTPAAFPVSIS
jgi:hypothetical protein